VHTEGAMTLAEFLADRFAGRPTVGDRTRFGAVELIVREMQGDLVTQVGVELEPIQKNSLRSRLRALAEVWLDRLWRKKSYSFRIGKLPWT
jgi:NhaP-type Na+/H+ and K+/H+ antiporter